MGIFCTRSNPLFSFSSGMLLFACIIISPAAGFTTKLLGSQATPPRSRGRSAVVKKSSNFQRSSFITFATDVESDSVLVTNSSKTPKDIYVSTAMKRNSVAAPKDIPEIFVPFPLPNQKGVERFIKDPRVEIGLALLVFASLGLFTLQSLDGVVAGQPGGYDLGEKTLSFINTGEHAIGLV